jgi:hypothetical protein
MAAVLAQVSAAEFLWPPRCRCWPPERSPQLRFSCCWTAFVLAQPKAAPKANSTTNGTMDDHAGHDHAAGDHGAAGPMAMTPTAQNGHGAAMDHGAMGHGGNMTVAKALSVPDSCVTAPMQGNCSTFDYPHANAANDLTRLCNAMSFMTGAKPTSYQLGWFPSRSAHSHRFSPQQLPARGTAWHSVTPQAPPAPRCCS